MRREKQSGLAGAGEHALELAWWVAPLGRIQADADDAVAERKRGVERALGVGLVEVSQEAHDQARRDAEVALRVGDGAGEAIDHGCKGDAARRVALRIEEHLDM